MEIRPGSLAIRLLALFAALASLGSCALPDRHILTVSPGLGTPVPATKTELADGASLSPTTLSTPGTATPDMGVQATSQGRCAEIYGRFEQVDYSSQLTGEYVPVLVYLPPCYSQEHEYPLLFLLHGKPQDEKHWRILGIDDTVTRRIQAGEMPGVVLVMPRQPEPLFSQTDGGPGSYEEEFFSTLVPFIDTNYAVSNQPALRALAGISRGGVWALELAFTHPESFQAVAALSPALNVNAARETYDPLVLARDADGFPEHIFLASGDTDSAAADTERLHLILTERGIEHRYTIVPGGHEGATWKQLLGEMLDYLTSGW